MTAPMDEAITACVHCGFCLPSCPTYQQLGDETDSPRGRIYLMKQVLEGRLDAADAQPHIDRCLGCLACETSCPSGVPYHRLISPYRATIRPRRGWWQRLQRRLAMLTLPHPARFRWAVRLGGWTRILRPLLPKPTHAMLDLLPARLPEEQAPHGLFPASGHEPPRARVALLAGCVQRALDPAIQRATIEVLNQNGVEVLVPEPQGCCGSLAWHVGEADAARKFARALFDAFPSTEGAAEGTTEDPAKHPGTPAGGGIDAIVVNAAGCSSGMREYALMFEGAGPAERARAAAFAALVTDVSVLLHRLGITPPPPLRRPLRVAYHDACHLGHAQGVRAQPRALLRAIPGLELVELDDGERCCGSAGTYNIDQPEIARDLGQEKAAAIEATRCDLVVTGNIGCMVQIRTHLAAARRSGEKAPPVLHTVQALALAYRGRLGVDVAAAAGGGA